MASPILGIIYKITNLLNGKCYVGLSVTELKLRLRKHISNAKLERPTTAICRAIAKYGWENFRAEVIEPSISISTLGEREKFWIAELRTRVPKGYNISAGGYGVSDLPYIIRKRMGPKRGSKRSAETILKMSLALKGRKWGEEERERRMSARSKRPKYHHSESAILKMSESAKRRRLTAEQIQAMKTRWLLNGHPSLGRKRTEEQRKRMSAAQTGVKRKPLKESHKRILSERMKGSNNPFFGHRHPPELAARIVEKRNVKIRSPEGRRKMSASANLRSDLFMATEEGRLKMKNMLASRWSKRKEPNGISSTSG